jgi:WD40 repeat protein
VVFLTITFAVAWNYRQLQGHNAELAAAADRERAGAERERTAALEADRQRQLAEERGSRERRQAYVAKIWNAGQLFREGKTGLLGELLNDLRPQPGEEDLRGFECRYLWRQSGRERFLRGKVQTMALSPDGGLCASYCGHFVDQANRDLGASLRLWDVSTGRELTRPDGTAMFQESPDGRPPKELLGYRPGQPVFSPDGKKLLTARIVNGRAITKRWDLATGRPSGEDQFAYDGFSHEIALAPDLGSLVVGLKTAAEAPMLLLRDLGTRRLRQLASGPGTVTAVAFSPDGRLLAAGYERTTAGSGAYGTRLWDLASGQELAQLPASPSAVEALAFSPDGRRLASGSRDGIVRIEELARGRERMAIRHSNCVSHLAFSPDGTTLACATSTEHQESDLTLWDADTGRRRSGPIHIEANIHTVAFFPDGRRLGLACGDDLVRLREVEPAPDSFRLSGHHGKEVWSVAFSPDGHTLASASDDHTIVLWDPATRAARATLRGHGAMVGCVTFSPDGGTLASASDDHTVRLWDAATGRTKAVLEGHPAPVRCLAFSPDGRLLATGDKGRAVRVWDVAARQPQLTFPLANDGCRGLAFAPGDGPLAFASDRTVSLWHPESGAEPRFDDDHLLWCIALSPDGRTLATGTMQGTISLWDVATGKRRAGLRGHREGVHGLAFSPDGKTLASGSDDRTVRLWHVAAGQELLALPAEAEVYSVAFSPDGRSLAAALYDGSIKLWQAGDN